MSTLVPPIERTAATATGAAPPPPLPPSTPAARRGVAVLVLRVAALAVGIVSSIVLARWLGPAGLGTYETAMAWGALLAVPAGLGADKLVVREVAANRARGQVDLVRGIAKASAWAVAASAGVVAIGATIAMLLLGDQAPSGLLLMACGFVPLAALLRARQAVLQGLAHVAKSQLTELLIAPVAFLLLLGALVASTGALTPTAALTCQVAAFATALLVAIAIVRHRMPADVRQATPSYQLPTWARAAVPVLAIACLQVLSARLDIVMLGALAHEADVGRYASANRLAALITMPLLAANAALGPAFAAQHARGDTAAMQATVTRAARWTLLGALPIAGGMLLVGDAILRVFGSEFAIAYDELWLLSFAQLANVAIGSVGLLLMMTGHMRAAAFGLALSVITNATLNALLIPLYGSYGAAIATTTALLAWNISHAFAVRRRLGIWPGALGNLRRGIA